jgi:hypothetical protein
MHAVRRSESRAPVDSYEVVSSPSRWLDSNLQTGNQPLTEGEQRIFNRKGLARSLHPRSVENHVVPPSPVPAPALCIFLLVHAIKF